MYNNSINRHICNNMYRNTEREGQRRLLNEGMTIENNSCRDENNCNYEENRYYTCNYCEMRCKNEHGGEVYVANTEKMAYKNRNFRESIWTGRYLQATLMSISCGDEIGVEMHSDTDQYIRVEYGNAIALTGTCEHHLCQRQKLRQGEVIFIPAGTWHNIINTGRCTLKLLSIYAPPHHPRCTVEKNK